MEKKRQEPEGIHRGLFQGGAQGQAGEQFDHKRIRSLSEEVPGTEAMLSDPGEPHKDIRPETEAMLSDPGEPHKDIQSHSSRAEQKQDPSGLPRGPAETQREPHEFLGEKDIAQIRPVLGEEDVSQRHPLLGDETVSMENEREERERRRMEVERKGEAERTSKKKPAA